MKHVQDYFVIAVYMPNNHKKPNTPNTSNTPNNQITQINQINQISKILRNTPQYA